MQEWEILNWQVHSWNWQDCDNIIMFHRQCYLVAFEQWSDFHLCFQLRHSIKTVIVVKLHEKNFSTSFSTSAYDLIPSAHTMRAWVERYESTGSKLSKKHSGPWITVWISNSRSSNASVLQYIKQPISDISKSRLTQATTISTWLHTLNCLYKVESHLEK